MLLVDAFLGGRRRRDSRRSFIGRRLHLRRIPRQQHRLIDLKNGAVRLLLLLLPGSAVASCRPCQHSWSRRRIDPLVRIQSMARTRSQPEFMITFSVQREKEIEFYLSSLSRLISYFSYSFSSLFPSFFLLLRSFFLNFSWCIHKSISCLFK